jgi:hypothetical protein
MLGLVVLDGSAVRRRRGVPVAVAVGVPVAVPDAVAATDAVDVTARAA